MIETSLITLTNKPGAYFVDGTHEAYSPLEAAIPSTHNQSLVAVVEKIGMNNLTVYQMEKTHGMAPGFCEKPLHSQFCYRGTEAVKGFQVESVTECIWKCQEDDKSVVRKIGLGYNLINS